ncbi:hypothetical protein N7476_001092 [Penicillium atrosanguineum]|uniref:D-serine dehydratase n=1 Tax=Penicillium atrosanguineum TaxID=1132637 RepID=A0A9W9UDC8_9EURO|nr:hypothetical protein N7476_001092 [Penicillium atrosanguineum]
MAAITLPSKTDLAQFWVGKDMTDVPKPAAVLDRAIIRRHCQRMKNTIKALNVGFRAHVKTHKTLELAAMQVDDTAPTANFIASTLLEIESLTGLLKALESKGQRINILYGIPLVPSKVANLANLAKDLGPDSISVMIDHPDQVPFLTNFTSIAGFPACVFIKVDTGYHRAGVPPVSLNKNGLLEKLALAEETGSAHLLGLYSHSSLSYSATTAEQAMGHLISEIQGCKDALNRWLPLLPKRELVISVGATPQVASSNNLVSGATSPKAKELMALLRDPCEGAKVKLELHAGNYPVLDMQQVSTNARIGAGRLEEEIALCVVAEVCSIYNDGERERAEVLLAAGTLALGREPCPSYSGWGVLSDWGLKNKDRLVVERISQEHAIVAWEGGKEGDIPLEIGQVVKVFPNHACVTGAYYGWYFVVDSDEDPSASKIVDIWIRGRGENTDPLMATRFQ